MSKVFTRKRIIDVTVDTVLIKGYDGMRTKEIADKAGVSEATVFKNFNSKEELLKIILTGMIDDFTAESKKIIGNAIREFSTKKRKSYAALLKSIISERLAYFLKESKLIRIIVREMLINEELKKLFADTVYNNLIGIFEVIILKGAEAGEFRREGRKTFIDMIFGMIIYNTVISPALSGKAEAKRIEEIADMAVKGLLNDSAVLNGRNAHIA
jgi:AcrR family transcriptional regulator